MSGHSKWATIKRKKGANDAIRGAMTTKISREITIAVKMGGADPTGNMRLKLALSKAKSNNVTKENINRAIQKGLGASDTSNYEEITYEGYGPGGAALMLDILTDNRNRTAANIRHIFSKHGGNLGENGCVAWMFKEKAVFTVDKETFDDEDALMEIAMDAALKLPPIPPTSTRLNPHSPKRALKPPPPKLHRFPTQPLRFPIKMPRKCRNFLTRSTKMTTFRMFTAIMSSQIDVGTRY